jgi:hypothetical protein
MKTKLFSFGLLIFMINSYFFFDKLIRLIYLGEFDIYLILFLICAIFGAWLIYKGITE